MKYYFVFDVESVGLLGEAFAVGWVIVDGSGKRLNEGMYAVDRVNVYAENVDAIRWANENVPPLGKNSSDIQADFRWAWKRAREKYPGIIMAADHPYPVETKFLSCLLRDEMPYPFIDINSVLHPNGDIVEDSRLPDELPRHNPLMDARQSARLFIRKLNESDISRGVEVA